MAKTKKKSTAAGKRRKKATPARRGTGAVVGYGSLFKDMVALLEASRRAAARSVNAIMTATYWEIGRRIVEQEQKGKRRAKYGEALLRQLAKDLTGRFGRGFSRQNLQQMRQFYLVYPPTKICQTPSGKFNEDSLADLAQRFPMPWSAYVRLLSVRNEHAREFYEEEALRGGWSVRQLNRQIGSQFYERTALSKNKAAMLTKGARRKPGDEVTAEEEIKDPYVLEFLGLKDEYSESDIEEALIRHLEWFLLELGGDFTFVGRQKRLRIGDGWYRIDLVFFHRKLRCLVLVDLKLEKLTPGDIGQMHTYCNYARRHWTNEGENPPVGLILCADENRALAEYALDGLPNKVMAGEYRTALPDEKMIVAELEKTRRLLGRRKK
jgi:predicted nuclease of restriction endonuclease-like (RecB) superfamily